MANSRKAERREVEVTNIEISTYCHATEDCSRVESALRNVLHQDIRNNIKVNYSWLEGYYGNSIGVLSIKLTSKNHIEAVLSHLASALDELEKSVLKTTFDLRFDPKTGKFVIRLSKQDLYHGSLKVVDSDDVVKLILYIKNAKKRDNVVSYLQSIGILPSRGE